MTTTQTMPVIASGGYVLDPTASEVAITARGAFGARVQASIDLVDVQVDVAADPGASRAQATFDMSSFQSGNGRRDKDIRNRFFRADENPTMTFTSTRLQVGADGRWELAGRLEYRAACDVTLELSVLEADERGFHARGTATVDRYACGVTKGRGLVGRWVDVVISVRLCRV
jgi:polyisoprenoid-binding protein YceI